MRFITTTLLGLGSILPVTFALTEGSWKLTAYSEDDCGGDVIGEMTGDFVNSDNTEGNDGGNVNGCLDAVDGRVINSYYLDFIDTNNNGVGNTYTPGEGFSGCSGPGTYYDGARPGLERNSCEFHSAPGCSGLSKFQSSTIMYSGSDSTCLGIGK
ncbi:hypothetical protein GGR57DRAFT_515335 [Xylariaceae sp. FL1272]|nr:hypothetical protein GGR57DRAFT_515335 [Xylariaceae sp. FL1272]